MTKETATQKRDRLDKEAAQRVVNAMIALRFEANEARARGLWVEDYVPSRNTGRSNYGVTVYRPLKRNAKKVLIWSTDDEK